MRPQSTESQIKTMTQARAMEVAGEELKTVSLEGTSRHSETSAPKYASNPPLAQIMGRNQATIVRPSAQTPSRIFFIAARPKRVEKQRTQEQQ